MYKHGIFCLLLFFYGWKICAQSTALSTPIVSPNGAIAASLGLDQNGRLFYSVSYMMDKAAIEAVPRGDLGIVRRDADLSTGLIFVGVVSERKIVDAYRLLHGKRRECRNAALEKVFRFRNAQGKKLDVIFRAYNDGIAFRYAFPDAGADPCRVTGERTSFTIPEGTQRWLQQYTSAYEGLYPAATTGKADAPDHQQWGFPALYKVQDKPVWVLISEAGVSRQNCASRLSNSEDHTVYRVTMPQDEVSADFPWKSAWRVLMIGSLADIVQSTLITDVAAPPKGTDTGWIRPGTVAWVYWAYNHGSKDYHKIVEYVDLAVTMHWPYVLIDWEWDRMENGGKIEDAVAYARSKGIKPLLWYNSRDSLNSSVGLDPYGRLTTHAARCREFAWLNKIGVYGIKVDFFEDDRQSEMAYYLDLLEDAAKYHLMVDFHGATIPKGWERTYPNLMTMEAVYGAEWYGYAPVLTKNGAAHNATLPFTRNVVGPMDYTPVTFTSIGFPHTTTYAHELALSVVFESGLQHFADRPQGFYALPDAERNFLMQVPVAWDDTRLVEGYPGKRVVIARRKGRAWYLGGLNGEDQPQDLKLNFDFLGAGVYTLELMADGAGDKEFSTQKVTITKGSTLDVNCLPRGGFAAKLTPAVAQIQVLGHLNDPGRSAPAQRGGIQPMPKRIPVAQYGVMQQPNDKVQWLLDARFGMFIHWGLYSGAARGEWYMENAAVPIDKYRELAYPASGKEYFDADKFDPDAWAALAKKAGMRYMCLTAMHHDGYALFDSRYMNSFTSKQTLNRDFVKEYTDACRRAGLKVGIYKTLINWRYPGYFDVTGKDAKKNRWNYTTDSSHKENARLMKEGLYADTKTLMTRYGKIDMIFWDGGWLAQQGTDADAAGFWESGAYLHPDNPWPVNPYFQDIDSATGKPLGLMGLVRKYQPDVIVNPRSGWMGDFESEEGSAPITGPVRTKAIWQKCMTMGGAWGYTPAMEDTSKLISLAGIKRMIADVTIRNMSLLLNVGPDRHGVISAAVTHLLEETGAWLSPRAEAIYGTYGGPWDPQDGRFGFAYRDSTIYIYLLDDFKGNTFTLPSVNPGQRVTRAYEVGRGSTISFSQDRRRRIRISFPPADDTIRIFAVVLNRKVERE